MSLPKKVRPSDQTMEEYSGKSMNEIIPKDLFFEIFLKISIKPLFRLRCVCKTWCNFIDDPLLYELHSSQDDDEEPLILAHWFYRGKLELMGKKFDRPLRVIVGPEDVRSYAFESSCNGLLCFVNYLHRKEGVFIYNPLRKQRLTLPRMTVEYPWLHLEKYVIGFDHSINKYKIVRVFLYNEDKMNERYLFDAQVCTVGTANSCSWRNVLEIPHYSLYKSPVCANGAVHWLVYNNFSSRDGLKSMILSFDFVEEEFDLIPHPEFRKKSCEGFDLVDLGGSLGVVDYSSTATHVEVWKLKDYGKKVWVMEWRIDRDPFVRVMGFWRNDEILLNKDNRLFVYDKKTNGRRRINDDISLYFADLYIYRCSLISLSHLSSWLL